MTAIDLSKQQAHNTDPTATQHINYTVNLDRDVDTRMLFILAKQKKETILDFSQGNVRVL